MNQTEDQDHAPRATNTADALFVATEFRRLATKLRWLGRLDEAARLEAALIRIAPPDFVLVLADDTD